MEPFVAERGPSLETLQSGNAWATQLTNTSILAFVHTHSHSNKTFQRCSKKTAVVEPRRHMHRVTNITTIVLNTFVNTNRRCITCCNFLLFTNKRLYFNRLVTNKYNWLVIYRHG